MSIFANEGQVKTALEDLRNDTSQTNWVAFGYAGSSENVELVGTGSNGITGVLEHFKDDVNAYAVLGITVTEEAAQFTKYIFISWVGPSVKPLHKGRSSQHRLPIYKFCNTIVQLAGEYQALTLEDVTEEKLKQKLSGSKHTEGGEAASDVLKAKGAGASEKFQFEDEAGFKTDLQDLQKGKINWILLGYDHGREEVVKNLGKGEGDLNEFAGKLSDDDVAYIIYGQKIAEAGDFVTVKYICITWVGPNVKPLHRARSSQHRVQIYNFSKKEVQLAGEIQILNKSELTEQGLVEKLSGTFTVGAKSEEELRAAAEADAKKKQGSAQAKPKAKEEDVKSPLSDEAGVKPILEDLGKPDSPTNWVAFGYDKDNKNQSVNFLQKGTGNLDEIHSLLNDDAVVYIVLGHIQDEGDYSTLKFLFITFVGPKVKPMVKARSSQHRVLLYNFVNKTVTLHGELQILNKEELTLGLLNEKITGSRHVAGESSGKAQAAVEQARQTAGARKGVAASKDQFTWSNEEEAKNKIIDVRSNKANWVAFGHKSNDVLQVIGSGNGSLDELKVHFKDEDIVYAVLSVVAGESECEGDYKLNKFVFISWVGPEVKPLVKARSSQHRVALYNFVKPILALHGELQFLSQADVSMDVIRKKIGDTQ